MSLSFFRSRFHLDSLIIGVISKRKQSNGEQPILFVNTLFIVLYQCSNHLAAKLPTFNSLILGSFCRERQLIDFYEASNLLTVLQSYSVAPDYPGRLCMCNVSPRTLVYTDCKQNKQVVKWLDCSNYPPTPTNKITNIQIKPIGNHTIQDMCCVAFRKKKLLITAQSYGGVYAYIAGTDNLKWRIGGCHRGIEKWMNAVGITSNGRGQLFISDMSNKCIQMLSTNGTFLGTVLRRGKLGLGNPQRIRWCDKANSLVIAHEKQGLFSIDVYQWLYSL